VWGLPSYSSSDKRDTLPGNRKGNGIVF